MRESYSSVVPTAWHAALPAELSVIEGQTSWATRPNRIEISEAHATGSRWYLDVVVAHEYGHLVGFAHGSGLDSWPNGWPPATSRPEEHWADCAQQVFTGTVAPSYGLPPCDGRQLAWARKFLVGGPPR